MSADVTMERLASIACSGLDLVTLWREVTPLITSAVPHFEAPCFFTVDPSSLLTTSHFQEGLPEIPAEWLAREYARPDFNSMTEVLRSPSGVGTLHDATGGEPRRAAKYHEEMRPFGCEQELVFALRTRTGERWGAIGLYREHGRPLFTEWEKSFAAAAGRILADGARFALLLGQGTEPDLPAPPGVIVLDTQYDVVSVTPAAETWLTSLGGSLQVLPAPVLAVAGSASAGMPDAFARVQTDSGRWVMLQGSRMRPSGQIALVVGLASASHVAPLLLGAYGLTKREQDVVWQILTGGSTLEVSRALGIAEDTVQQHLGNAFAKTGTRSRGELINRIFHAHYEPRVRDNEVRAQTERPLRSGPMH